MLDGLHPSFYSPTAPSRTFSPRGLEGPVSEGGGILTRGDSRGDDGPRLIPSPPASSAVSSAESLSGEVGSYLVISLPARAPAFVGIAACPIGTEAQCSLAIVRQIFADSVNTREAGSVAPGERFSNHVAFLGGALLVCRIHSS